ncbi:MAG: chemotaxis protein CheW [Methylicorpusculum sp.]|uniref:chemotaxis protein CheW n=1 Tax=Methylicorpusculum sp. TaxID=2713644 RepID=UPI00271C551D|nr:chemotaxis protein CheW [Methylicorpusculum sp.]MDO8845169.1 chemotaxis protein CheW [Methylicorpusculum sp.]MDO8938875.1 chemotaxis protein CheW [Methylicorpusculum sp.]MDO9241243.1 chemotaxis protein CheW [Methylicorpusculum sp.]MDP2177975.1 chemotaxis protein CheW [Methylicorpusculum sp.]MDP2202885.1 chemotaxis protein CheW [Methylicorpusculum sp.]
MKSENQPSPNDKEVNQFLTFELAGDSYAVEILKVQEIRGWEPVRKIPNTPGFIKGALNLRGTIVPVLDLRERFGLENVEYTPVTVVIVLSINNNDHPMVLGVIADTVSDVLDLNLADIKPAPNFGVNIDTRYMRGIYVAKQGMIMLLDVDKLLDVDDLTKIESLL